MNAAIYEPPTHVDCCTPGDLGDQTCTRVAYRRQDRAFNREVLVFWSSLGFREPLRTVPSRPAILTAPPVERRSEWAVRIHEFREFVLELSKGQEGQDGEPLISPNLARTALRVWWKLYASCAGDLSVPDVGPGHHGELIFIWKRNDHYLSVEIAPDAPAKIFYRNQRTGAIWGHDFDPSGHEVPRPIIEKLCFFLVNE